MVELIVRQDRPLATARTDEEGRFALLSPGPGACRLRGSSEGYPEAMGQDLPMRPGDTVQVELSLSRDAALGAPLPARPEDGQAGGLVREREVHAPFGVTSRSQTLPWLVGARERRGGRDIVIMQWSLTDGAAG